MNNVFHGPFIQLVVVYTNLSGCVFRCLCKLTEDHYIVSQKGMEGISSNQTDKKILSVGNLEAYYIQRTKYYLKNEVK